MSNTPMKIDVDTGTNNQSIDIFLDSINKALDIELTEEIRLDVDFGISSQSLSFALQENTHQLDIEMMGGGEGRYPFYAGPYEVDPRKVEQTLETENKSMSGNVVINPIYYAETSNPSGGYTVVIGLE